MDITGTLFVADQEHLPFVPRRVFWMNGLRGRRGGHALRTCEQIIIALRGEFNVRAYRDSNHPSMWNMKMAHHGLYLPKMIWRDLQNFTIGAIALVLCSEPYDPRDYIHKWSHFVGALR